MADTTVVCDLDGVVFMGDQEIAGSGSALTSLSDAGVSVVFCTNNSSRTREQVAAKIADVAGYPARPSQVFSSAMAAAYLVRGARRAHVVGGPGVHQSLTEVGIEMVSGREACDVVVVGLDVDLSYSKLVDATLAIQRGARLVATNHDATYPTPDGLYPGGGAIVALLETATDVIAEVAGKPHQAMQETIAESIGGGDVWMVGDRPDTDMAMAAKAGWRGVLVDTGIPKEGSDDRADLSVPDLAAFADFLLQRN